MVQQKQSTEQYPHEHRWKNSQQNTGKCLAYISTWRAVQHHWPLKAMQVKPWWDITTCPEWQNRMLKKKKKYWQYQVLMTMQSNWNFHTFPVGMPNGTAPVENHLVVSYKAKQRLTYDSSSPTPGPFPKWTENLGSTKIYLNVYSSSVHIHQYLETIQMSFNGWLCK